MLIIAQLFFFNLAVPGLVCGIQSARSVVFFNLAVPGLVCGTQSARSVVATCGI